MRKTALLAVMAALVLALGSCKSEVETKPIVYSTEIPTEGELYLCTMDAALLDGPGATHQPIGQVRDGDHLTLLEKKDKWCKVTHTPSGETGWIHSGAVTTRRRSQYWSGDTRRATETANKVYLVRDLDPLKLAHVKINEWSRTVTFYGDPKKVVEERVALRTTCQWADRIKEYFPDWEDSTIVFVGYNETEQYTILCSGTQDAQIIQRTPKSSID